MDDVARDSPQTALLLDQARAGERCALGELLTLHRAYLKRLVELHLDTRLRPRVDPSDVVQEAQLEVIRRFDDYLRQPVMPFRLWLRRLTTDRLLMLRRHHAGAARRAVGREVALPAESSLALAKQLLARGSSPSQRVNQQELAGRVRQAVAQLADADRDVLLMRTFEGLSFEEVALTLGIEPATARKRHGRALLRLGKLLAEGGLTESKL